MKHLLLVIALVILLVNTGLVIPVSGIPVSLINNVSPFESPYGSISVDAYVANYSITQLPVYHGVLRDGESVNKRFNSSRPRQNVTTPENAPDVANKVLEQYGGLPADAESNGAFTQYSRVYNYTLGQYVSKKPMSTTISYSQKMINDLWTIGDSNYIIVELGESDEVLRIVKLWRYYTYTGDVPVIPLNTAFGKLERGEVIDAPMILNEDITIDMATPGYYAKKVGVSDAVLEPIWIMYGNTTTGSRLGFYVYARRFANFTIYPSTEVTKYQPVYFSDTSETSPTKWYWDFGDGTNSTEQNPSHLYKTGGNYTVNLTVWNDMGSDTISRQDYVHVYYTSDSPVALFISNYPGEGGYTGEGSDVLFPVEPVTIQFTDKSRFSGDDIQWFWDFGDGMNSTEQNPVHTFVHQGEHDDPYSYFTRYWVNLTLTDNFGRTSMYGDYFWFYRDFHIDFAGEPVSGNSPLNVTFTELPDDFGVWNDTYEHILDFGDGSSYYYSHWGWENGTYNQHPMNVSHVYSSPGNYTVSFKKFGIWETLSTMITKEDYIHVGEYTIQLVPDFIANVTAGRIPLAVAFTDISGGSPSDWNWSLGDGTYSNDQNPVHVYPAAGTYTISLTTSNAYEANTTTKIDYISVYEHQPPIANLTANTTFGSEPLAVSFSDLSENGPMQWNWSFGDGDTSTEKDPVHTYASEGNYSVSLQVTNEYGSDTMFRPDYIMVIRAYPIVTIAVPPAQLPLADFTGTPVSGKEPLTVQFDDTSANFPGGWLWDFGDGTNATEENPVHSYTAAGSYTVSLNASNEAGTNTTIKIDYITVLPLAAPDANFTAEPTAGKAPLTVTFNDTSSGSPTTWLWDFGDGITSAEQDPFHEYATAGTYTVSLTATNDDGSDTDSRPDYITVTSPELPVADFNANTTSGIVPLAVEFTDTSSGSPTGWSWTFGDGGTSAEQNPVYVYSTTGQFTVSLQVTNEDGSNTTTKEQFITGSMLNLPVAEFIANTTSGNAPLAVGFTDQSTGSPVSWQWSFGDGATSDEQNPSHIYTDTGTYTVSLEVTNPDGSNTATKTDYITVTSDLQPPVAGLKGKPTCGKAPLTVKFNDTSTGSPTSWNWEFGDGSSTTEQNPVHIYTTAGKYTVSLMATNAGGSNTSTRIDYITVSGSVKPPVANFHGKPTSGKAPLSVKFTDASTGSPTTWYWDFGDGTNVTDRNPRHSYTTPGKYTVSLTVTNAGGSDTKTRTEYITVKGTPPPSANFYGKPTYGKAPLSVKFTDASAGSPTSWFWDFGDGTNEIVQHPVHSYTAAGKYTVSLTAYNNAGNTTKTRVQYITVKGTAPTPTPTHTCTTKPTATCTTKPTTTPTHTCTQSQCEPHEAPGVTGTTENGKIRLDWDVITNPCLQGYKVVISKNNPNPKYPDDGYMFWITDRNRNYAVISSTDHYNGGDFGGYLQPGQSYYFSVTAVYSDKKVAGNVVELEYPA